MNLRKVRQKDCPACIDMTYWDRDGVEHVVFNICPTHLAMGEEENARDFKDTDGKNS